MAVEGGREGGGGFMKLPRVDIMVVVNYVGSV